MCGRAYKVKDELGGRSIRCKSCGEATKIPHPEAEPYEDDFGDDSYEDDYGDSAYDDGYDDDYEDDYEHPRRRSSAGSRSGRRSSSRKSSKTKRRKSRKPSNLPGSVIGAITIEAILVCPILYVVFVALGEREVGLALAGMFQVAIGVGAIAGYIARLNVVRILAMILTGIGIAFNLVCCMGVLMVRQMVIQLVENQMRGRDWDMFNLGVGITIAVTLVFVAIRVGLIALLMTPASKDHFDR